MSAKPAADGNRPPVFCFREAGRFTFSEARYRHSAFSAHSTSPFFSPWIPKIFPHLSARSTRGLTLPVKTVHLNS
jgi:hypothetical protein